MDAACGVGATGLARSRAGSCSAARRAPAPRAPRASRVIYQKTLWSRLGGTTRGCA
eukprot:CAMPEP_0206269450 /NCGR_PEP_ID=MMETSP0047_2-20121206/32294_1 /ASSEMBLY_ACC=CAM_ASM_000192 /TAXON_ID=195065 /ORGANISM="Chroomonas mesostigmatica_cf, Strain CCMP1168" /LENGTH=55 /DNA_ID=CAMNT_0053697931 /DNA_START=32 /DNA_END=195 /DNA_ORIENTATION=-